MSGNPFLEREATRQRDAGRTLRAIGRRQDPMELEVLYDPSKADPKVLEQFALGNTIGVFQFHTGGMTGLLRAIKPDRIEDLAAANALYRPGAMKTAFDYAKRKHGEVPEDEWYWHPSIKPFMEETYGILAYQEQVMAIVKALGGFTPGEADGMRKGISKWYRLGKEKCVEKLRDAGFETQWFRGAREFGLSDADARKIWDNILEFAGYGFNKSHSASYAVQAYQDMHLKVYNALEFYSAILSLPDDEDGWIKRVVREAEGMGVSIKAPDINRSLPGFSRSGDEILYGFETIKGMGYLAATRIVEAREQGGPFDSYYDFCKRAKGDGSAASKFLIRAGAFDEVERTGPDDTETGRYRLLSTVHRSKEQIPRVTFKCGHQAFCRSPKAREKFAREGCPKHGDKDADDVIVADEMAWEDWYAFEHIKHNADLVNPAPLPDERTSLTRRQAIDFETEALGVCISIEPSVVRYWGDIVSIISEDGKYAPPDDARSFEALDEGDYAVVAGEIARSKVTKIKKKNSKQYGREMAFVDIARLSDEFNCTLFPDDYLRFGHLLETADCVVVEGKKNTYNGKSSIVVSRMEDVEDFVKTQQSEEDA